MFMYVYLEINSYPKLSVKLMMIMMTEIRRRGGLNSSPEVDRSYKYKYRGISTSMLALQISLWYMTKKITINIGHNRNSRKFRTVIDKMNCRFFNNENPDPLVLLNKSWVSEIWYIEWTIGITVTQLTLHVLELGLTLLRFLDTPDAQPVSVWWTRIGICSGSSTTDLTCNKTCSIIYIMVIPLWLEVLHN